MTMVAGRILQRRDTPKSFARPLLKIPSPKLSSAYEDPYDYLEFRKNSFDIELLSPTLSNSPKATVALSTPSPSAIADGYKVDFELEKFRRLSEEWIRNRDTEEDQNKVDYLGSRSPSPQRVLVSPNKFINQRTPLSLNQRPRSLSPVKTPIRSISRGQDSPTEILRSLRARSPSPLVYSPVTKTFIRPDETENKSNIRRFYEESSRADSRSRSYYAKEKFDLRQNYDYSQNSSYGTDRPDFRQSPNRSSEKFGFLSLRSPSLLQQKPAALSSIFRRSHSYESDDQIRSNFRSRSISPSRLNPASSYYHRSNSVEDRDYSSRSRSRSPSPQSSTGPYPYLNLFKRSESYGGRSAQSSKLENVLTDSYGDKYNTLPRFRYMNQTSPTRDNPFRAAENRALDYLKTFGKSFLVNSIPELPPPATMPTPQRRSSEEPPSSRKQLATLHEDEDQSHRRFSDSVRRSPFSEGYRRSPFSETSRSSPFRDQADEDNYYRRLSEAGVRKCSDASVVLTEDTDSFIIGDRVWVGGIKPGSISYLGETQFAPGDWAGVTLDDVIGKNDGSVAGVRYFQCEAKKGVFSRLSRLSRTPLSDRDLEFLAQRNSVRGSDSPKSMSTPTPSVASGPTQRKITIGSNQVPVINSVRKNTPPIAESVRKTTPSSVVKNNSAPGNTPAPSTTYRKTSGSYQDLIVGDKVSVDSSSGVKHGILRHLGVTEFADGIWAGVELDEATGKNDGSVAGKKYFTCRPKHGLFAPINRVHNFSGRAASSRSGIPSIRRSRSRESLGASSVGSVSVSSVRAPGRPTRTSAYDSPSTRAFQEALSEKTQHIDQLMRERDIERNEVSRMANQLDEAMRTAQNFKVQLAQNQIESEERLHDFEQKILALEAETKELNARLEDKQREIDDLNFQVEEESLAKADYQSQNTSNVELLKSLEDQLSTEKKKVQDRREKEVDKVVEMEEIELSLHQSVEELQGKIMELEQEKENLSKKLEQSLENYEKLKISNFSLSNSINEKDQKINLLELSQIVEKNNDKKSEEFLEMERNLEVTKSLLERKFKDLEDASQQAEEFLADIEMEQQKRRKVEEEMLELHDRIKTITNSESQLKVEVDKFAVEAVEWNNTLENYKGKLAELENDKENISKEMLQYIELNTNLKSEKSSLLIRLHEREEQVALLELAKSNAGSTAEEKVSEIIQLKEKLLILNSDLEKRNKDLEDISLLNKDLSAEVEKERLEKSKILQELNDNQAELKCISTKESELTLEFSKAKEEVKDWKTKFENYNGRVAELEEEKVTLVRNLDEYLEKNKNYETENVSLKSSLIEKEERISQLNNAILTAEAQGAVKSDEVFRLEECLKVVKLELENQLKNAEDTTQQAEALKLEVERGKIEKLSTDEKLQELQEQVKLKIDSESQFKSEVSKLNDESKKWKTSFENCNAQMDSIMKENKDLKNDLESSAVSVQTLNSQIEELQNCSTILAKELADMKVLEEEKLKLIHNQKQLEDKLTKLSEVEKINCILLGDKSKIESELANIKHSEMERNQIMIQNQKLKEELESLKNLESEFSSLKAESKMLECKVERISELEQMLGKLNNELEEKNCILKIHDIEKKSINENLAEKSAIEVEYNQLIASLQSYKDEISNLECANKQLKLEISKLEESKFSFEKLNQELTLNIQNLEDLKSSNETEKEQLKQCVQNIEDEKSRYENDNEQLKFTIQNLEKCKLCFENDNEQLKIRVQNLEDEKSCYVIDMEQFKIDMKNLKEEKANNENDNEQLKLQIQNIEESKLCFEKENEQLKLHMQDLKDAKSLCEKDNEKFKLQIQNLEEGKLCCEQNMEQLKLHIQQLEERKSCFEKENEQLKLQMQDLTDSQSSFEKDNEQLKLQIQNLEEGKLCCEQNMERLKLDIQQLEEGKSCFEKDNEQLKLQIQNLEERKLCCEQNMERLKLDIQQLEEGESCFEKDNEQLKLQIQNLEERKLCCEQNMERLKLDIQQLEEGKSCFEKDNEQLKMQIQNLEEGKLCSEQNMEKLKVHILQLEEGKSFFEKDNEQLKLQIHNLEEVKSCCEKDNDHLKTNLNELMEKKSDLEKVNNKLMDDITELKEEKSCIEKERDIFKLQFQNFEEGKSQYLEESLQSKLLIQKFEEEKCRTEQENELLKVDFKKLEENIVSYEKEIVQLKNNISGIEEEKASYKDEIIKLKIDVNNLKEDKSGIEKLKLELESSFEEQKVAFEKDTGVLKVQIQDLEGRISDQLNLYNQLKHESTTHEEAENELKRQLESLQLSFASLKNIEDDYMKSTALLSCLTKEKEDLEICIVELQEKLSNLEIVKKEKDSLEKLADQLAISQKDIETRLGIQIQSLEADKITSANEMETFQMEIAQLKEGLIWSKEEIETRERQNSDLQARLLNVESEKTILLEEVKQLRKAVISKGSEPEIEGDEFATRLKAERDEFEGQVSFLNSVIVGMQEKKEDLERRIAMMQTSNVPDDEKANMNILKEKKKLKAPRVFCDICDCFDLHDTEDCPTQATSDSPPPSSYHVERGSTRPYCTACEVFGHEEGECPEDDTY